MSLIFAYVSHHIKIIILRIECAGCRSSTYEVDCDDLLKFQVKFISREGIDNSEQNIHCQYLLRKVLWRLTSLLLFIGLAVIYILM